LPDRLARIYGSCLKSIPRDKRRGGECPSLDALSSVTAWLLLHRNGQSGGA
jgi:hypothetical protein